MKLEGIRVIDLSQYLPGPHLTMMMADHGAEVIKIENPQGGEPTREIGLKQGGQSIYFRNTQRGKQSLTLNLKHEAGREALLRLAESADVLLESFRPGVMDRLGVGADEVRTRAPGLVYCSISAFGQSGTHRTRPAHDLSVQALAGVLPLTGQTDGTPVIPNLPAADMLGSLMAFSAILMALLRRRQTGRGDTIDIAMFDAVLSWTANATVPLFGEGRPPNPAEERVMGGAALYQVYRTADGRHITLGGSEAKFAVNLFTALERPDLIEASRRPPGPAQQPVKDFLAETFATRTQAQWVDWFADKDVCFAPVRDLAEAYADPFVEEREMRLRDEAGRDHIGIPIKYAEEPGRVNFHAPELGEHSRRVLRGLGYGEAEIERMKAEGVW